MFLAIWKRKGPPGIWEGLSFYPITIRYHAESDGAATTYPTASYFSSFISPASVGCPSFTIRPSLAAFL